MSSSLGTPGLSVASLASLSCPQENGCGNDDSQSDMPNQYSSLLHKNQHSASPENPASSDMKIEVCPDLSSFYGSQSDKVSTKLERPANYGNDKVCLTSFLKFYH